MHFGPKEAKSIDMKHLKYTTLSQNPWQLQCLKQKFRSFANNNMKLFDMSTLQTALSSLLSVPEGKHGHKISRKPEYMTPIVQELPI
ncbi:hypothetical protein TIFTF001_039038 [Ficus carica]|uniref:Uncharacterized protein n=1 Tax=Ficus carica TaxID=3494 RepID=A0AA88E8D6_FICCA|nr:hypothetical protein TIFTF001_039036 [Ficus carica]GMN69992.1 hypothetical protein TIFTF001_039038 [Ficus carica]